MNFMKNVNDKFLRAFRHNIKIDESERNLPCHEYIHKYVLMHGSLLLWDRYLQRIGGEDSLTFEVTYVFNDNPTDEKIIEALKEINALQ